MIDSNNIIKTIKSQSTGNEDSVIQAFSQNHWVKINPVSRKIFSWETPVYTIEGATRNYYDVDYNGLSTDINNGKNIIFIFSANTFSISGITTFNHKMYRIDYESFVEAKNNYLITSAYTDNFLNSLSTPFYEFVDYATGTTGMNATMIGNRYTYNFPTQIKPNGQFTVDVFKDKSQYFIDSEFSFPMEIDLTLGDFYILSGDSLNAIAQTLDYYKNEYQILYSNLGSHSITGDTIFGGLSVNGAFFSYIVPPTQPNLYVSGGDSQIAVQGVLSTFSPTFNFNRVHDGDYYQLQVTYNPIDYLFEDSTNLSVFNIDKQEGDAEYVRTFSVPLTPNKQFLYRIGNVKEIENIFGVKQSTIVYSDYISAETASDGKYIFSGTAYQGYVDASRVLSGVSFELRGVHSNATVRKKIDIKNPNVLISQQDDILGTGQNSGVLLTSISNANGDYTFGRIDGGTYVLTVIPPVSLNGSVDTKSYNINISSDTDFDVVLSILWSSTSVRFYDPYTFL